MIAFTESTFFRDIVHLFYIACKKSSSISRKKKKELNKNVQRNFTPSRKIGFTNDFQIIAMENEFLCCFLHTVQPFPVIDEFGKNVHFLLMHVAL